MLPFDLPVDPMLAMAAETLPEGPFLYEPKWDGFRCLVGRDGDDLALWSRQQRPLTRYFPELVEPLRAALPPRCVVDGEVAVVGSAGLDFDRLGQRIHPAESRINRLAAETPAVAVLFDLLALGDDDLRDVPLRERRRRLIEAVTPTPPTVLLTPGTTDIATAREWFAAFEGAGLDGIVAKPLDGTYTPGVRSMVKVKHHRSADCVLAGFRIHKDGEGVGSLLLGLYDDEEMLHHVGSAASFSAARRRKLLDELEPVRMTPDEAQHHPWAEWGDPVVHERMRMPGAQHRWSAQKTAEWEPVRPELVCEVTFDQLTARRFRHNAKFLRWRPDRDARSCRYDQLEVASPVSFATLFGDGPPPA